MSHQNQDFKWTSSWKWSYVRWLKILPIALRNVLRTAVPWQSFPTRSSRSFKVALSRLVDARIKWLAQLKKTPRNWWKSTLTWFTAKSESTTWWFYKTLSTRSSRKNLSSKEVSLPMQATFPSSSKNWAPRKEFSSMHSTLAKPEKSNINLRWLFGLCWSTWCLQFWLPPQSSSSAWTSVIGSSPRKASRILKSIQTVRKPFWKNKDSSSRL